MRVAHVSTIHRPLDSRIFYKECKTLVRAGYDVFLIVHDPPRPQQDGIHFIALSSASSKSHWRQLPKRLIDTCRKTISLQAKLYHLHDPELIPIGMLLKLMGKMVIYDVHEDTPQQALSLNQHQPLKGYLKFLIWSSVEAAGKLFLDAFVCATPDISNKFPPKRTTTVYNFCLSEDFISSTPVKIRYGDRPNRLVYVGGITVIRGIREMIQTLSLLPDSLDVELFLAGAFDAPTTQAAVMQSENWQQVRFLGWQSRRSIQEILASARIGLVLLHPMPNYVVSYPIKLFEYMAAGLPVIASDFPLWRELIETAECGLLVDPLSPKAIAQAIQYLLENPEVAEAMGQRGREVAKTRYNWNSEASKLLELYTNLEKQRL